MSSQGNRYRARICVDKIEYTICDAESEEEAARAYDLGEYSVCAQAQREQLACIITTHASPLHTPHAESLRFGKIRFLNFVYKGINDTVLPPGLEAALMASGKLPTSSAMFDSMGPPAMAHTPVGGTPLPSNGSPHYIGVSSRTGSKSKSRPAAQQAGSMGMGSSGRRAKGAPSLFSNGRGGSTSPAGFQGATPVFGSSGVWAMPKSKAYGPVGLPSGSTPLARAIMVYPAYPPPSGTSIGTQTALRPAQLPGLLHAQDVSDSDIVSDDGDGDGAGESGRSEGGLGEDEDEEARGRAGRGWPTQPRLAGASSQGYGLPRRESGVYEEELEERESKDEMYLHSTSSTPPSLLPSALPDLPQAGGKRKRSAYFRPQGASSSPIPAIAPSQVLAVLASEREQSGLEVKVARYTRLLSFLTRPDVRALLSDAQVRSAKRMILTGGEAILALLLSAVDSYEEQVEAAQDTHLQQHQPTGGQVGSSPALRLSAVAEEAGGLHLTLNEADDELDGMRIDHPAPPAPAPRASSSSYPISTVTAPHGGQAARMVAAGYELIDSLAATYKLWLDVGRLHGLVVAQDRGQPSSLPPLMPQVGMESDAQPAKGAGAAALDAPAAFPAGQVTMEDG